MKPYGDYQPEGLKNEYVPDHPKPKKKAKKRSAALSKRSKKKMDDGRRDLENECMALWVEIVSFGKQVCEWCNGKVRHSKHDCHHVYSRGSSPALKYEPENGIYLGARCHMRAENEGSMEFSDFLKDYWGPERLERLKLRRGNYFKNSASNLELPKIGLQNQLNKMKKSWERWSK